MVDKKSDLDGIVPYALLGGGLLAGSIIGFWVLPQVLKMLNPQEKKADNPSLNPNPQQPQQEMQPNPDLWVPQPNYTFGGGKKLYRFSHSATSKDQQSSEAQFTQKQLLERMDFERMMAQKSWQPKTVDLSPPANKRFIGGSDGHSRTITLQRPRQTKRQRWRIKR